MTFSSVCFSCITPHGAVASSLCRPKAVTCIVLKTSVIGSIANLPTGICVDYFPLETLESNPILEAFTVPVLWVPKAIQTNDPSILTTSLGRESRNQLLLLHIDQAQCQTTVQPSPLFWTNGQKIRTFEQFSSIAKESI